MIKSDVLLCYDYSYIINNKYSEVLCTSPQMLEIQITSKENISLVISPEQSYNVSLNDIIPFNVSITNLSQETLYGFNLILNYDDNLSLVNCSLINSLNKKAYPDQNMNNTFYIDETLIYLNSLNLQFYMYVNYQFGYIANPLQLSINAPDSNIDSNNSYLYLSVSSLSIITDDVLNNITVENTGTINSSSLMYKYLTPQNTTNITATINNLPFQDIIIQSLGPYSIFNIGSLPPSSNINPRILTIQFITNQIYPNV